MNKTVWLSRLLAIGGVLELGAGALSLGVPSPASSILLGAP